MSRCVVNVATGSYVKGQQRLLSAISDKFCRWNDQNMGNPLPHGWPSHQEKPYAFKAYALNRAASAFDTLLWADACVLPIRSMEPLWQRIERDGYWFSNNGWSNYQWTADSAYPDLFAPEFEAARSGNKHMSTDRIMEDVRALNKTIPHVVATAFGISLKHEIGRAFLREYFRLASETRAFCGPWINANSQLANEVQQHQNTAYCAPCGPPDVRGHRHDQVAASVIAWRLGMQLTNAPEIFAYGRAGDPNIDPRTILLADGSY
jgi:hypothetical protein